MTAGAEAGATSFGVMSREVVDSLDWRGGRVLNGGGAEGCEKDRPPAGKGWPDVGSVGEEFPGGEGGERAGG